MSFTRSEHDQRIPARPYLQLPPPRPFLHPASCLSPPPEYQLRTSEKPSPWNMVHWVTARGAFAAEICHHSTLTPTLPPNRSGATHPHPPLNRRNSQRQVPVHRRRQLPVPSSRWRDGYGKRGLASSSAGSPTRSLPFLSCGPLCVILRYAICFTAPASLRHKGQNPPFGTRGGAECPWIRAR